jgi:hypothetical protein
MPLQAGAGWVMGHYDALEQELIELDILSHCRSALRRRRDDGKKSRQDGFSRVLQTVLHALAAPSGVLHLMPALGAAFASLP